VHGPARMGTQPSSMLTGTLASVATGGKDSGCEKGAGVVVGLGVGVGVAVTVAVAVGVVVAVGVAETVAVAVGVALGAGPVYSMVSTGGLALSRVSNRLAVPGVDSSPRTSQPKLLAGSFSHDWTSLIICAELHV
jgi:hypothetical protein